MDPNLPQQVSPQPVAQPQPVASQPAPLDPYYAPPSGGSKIKKIAIVLVIILLLVGLVFGAIFAIGKMKGSGKPKNVTLTYWGLWDESAIICL